MATADQLVHAYVKLRDMKKEMQDRHKDELKPINEKMTAIEMGMLAMLKVTGAESVRTQDGTMYRLSRTNVKIEDWDMALNYIHDNSLWHMLEHRLAKSSVTEFVEANGTPPPGVSLNVESTVGVRRS